MSESNTQHHLIERIPLMLRLTVGAAVTFGTAIVLAWGMTQIIPAYWVWGGDGCPAPNVWCGYPPIGLSLAMVMSVPVLHGIYLITQSLRKRKPQ